MLQALQHQKTGEIEVADVPAPLCPENGILVRNCFSLISAGTEKVSVSNAKANLIARAKKQPEQVKTVLDSVKKEGIAATIRKVRSKLDSYKNLGYSTAGEVVESRCDSFAPGDRVACAGAGVANHAEFVAVPRNLAVRIPETVTFAEAAYATLGSIAMQGVRRADARLGERIAVIGLGLLGLLTVQILKAAGCKVIGLDVNENLFERAREFGCDYVGLSHKTAEREIKAHSDGEGFDSVIIAAGTSSNEPLELAIKLARKKGSIVIVGAVGMDLPRAGFYEKELDLKISTSYGPGRYDKNYEKKGLDYPIAYARWTENRNMSSFLELVAKKSVDPAAMTTHVFKITDAKTAYDLILGKVSEPFLGVALEYPRDSEPERVILSPSGSKNSALKIGFVGPGAFAQSQLMQPIKEFGAELAAVASSTPANALSAAKLHGFSESSTDLSETIKSKNVNAVFCAAQHDVHAKCVLESVRSGKPVFVEKPLCVTREQLEKIVREVEKNPVPVMVGFNRRFSKVFVDIKKFFSGGSGPFVMNYRASAGKLPKDHRVFDENQRGRIIGEVCHFIDCMTYLCGAVPTRVFAEKIGSDAGDSVNSDSAVISLKFSDGSIGAIEYFADGAKTLPKEYFEAHRLGKSVVMNNFESLTLYDTEKIKKIGYDGKKGHREEVIATLKAFKNGDSAPIPFAEIVATTEATLAAVESLERGDPVKIL